MAALERLARLDPQIALSSNSGLARRSTVGGTSVAGQRSTVTDLRREDPALSESG